jgi:hypothetical protein
MTDPAPFDPSTPDPTRPPDPEPPAEVTLPGLHDRGRARISVVKTVTHTCEGMRPHSVSYPYNRTLRTTEQPYERLITIGPDWEPLDLGWLAGKPIALVTLKNEEGRFHNRPTREELAEVFGRIVEVGFVPAPPEERVRTMHSPERAHRAPIAAFLIRPTESDEWEPAGAVAHVRCRSGAARCVLFIVPG